MKPECDHKGKKDLSQGLGTERHFICLKCGTHWYRDRTWTKEEWENWIES